MEIVKFSVWLNLCTLRYLSTLYSTNTELSHDIQPHFLPKQLYYLNTDLIIQHVSNYHLLETETMIMRDTNDAWLLLKSNFQEIIDRYVPIPISQKKERIYTLHLKY